MKSSIGAGIVLYNPDIKLLKENIEALQDQVDKILLYNNGSKNLTQIKKLSDYYTNVIIEDGRNNKGIAFALNRILDWSQEENYEWVLTMDQDSICDKNLIKEYTNYLQQKDVALICPFILNNNKYTLSEYERLKLSATTEIYDPVKCITSGCLTNVKIVTHLGGYNEKLFIDCVDVDLNCRVLQAKKRILRVNNTYLIQQMGKGKKISLFEKLQFITGNDLFRRAKVVAIYSDKRLYYYSRNSRYIRKKYKMRIRQMSALFIFVYLIYFSLFYPRNRSRIKMWRAIFKGVKDSNNLL